MKVLDGRNPYKVPEIIDIPNIESLEIVQEWQEAETVIYAVKYEDRIVPMVTNSELNSLIKEYQGVLCAAYKTLRGFTKWLSIQYPTAYQK